MGNSSSKSAAIDLNLNNHLTSDELPVIGSSTSQTSHDIEDPWRVIRITRARTALSNTSYLCPICLDVLADTTEVGATKYHSSLLSLEESVRSGCHLCILVKHFLPERPQHQLDEYLTLSLRWDGSWEGTLLAGWRHRMVSFHLVQEGRLTKFQQDYYNELKQEAQTTTRIYKRFATSMLTHCINHHPSCRNVQQPLWSPTRLIEIEQTTDGPKLRLITNQPQEPYIALSHCWGAAHMFTLSTENLEELKTDIKVSLLPKTFNDAISITTWLNVRYIWIDSCCIIQNSVEDWLEESAMMDDVYRNAYCTIAADCAVDSNRGCFVEQNTLAVLPCMISTDHGPTFCLPPEALLQKKFESEPLEQRAWALQERILSPRILHCTTDQLFWECNEDFKCQTYPNDLRANGDFRKVPRMMPQSFGRVNFHVQWNGVIEDYCKRSLTKEEDKLIALSGIAKAFQSRLTDDIYLAGLWYNSLPHALLWRVVDPAFVTRPSSFRAPSWSWASIDGRILPNNTETAMDKCQLCLEILSSDLDLVSEDPTGQIKGGSLQVHGLMKRATWCNSTQRLTLVEELLGIDNSIHKNSLKTSEISFFPDTSEIASDLGVRHLYCLLVQSQRLTMDGLVLCSTNDPDRFQRIGIFRAAGLRACGAVMYNLSPTVHNNMENPWQWYSDYVDKSPSTRSHGIYREPRAKALNITHRPDKPAGRNTRDGKIQPIGPEIFTQYRDSPYQQFQFGTGPWKSTNASLQDSWDPIGRVWTKDIGSSIRETSSPDMPWTPLGNLPSTQSVSSRRSKTKAVRAMHQARITDPLSIYLLDPAHIQEHYQKLKPRTIALV